MVAAEYHRKAWNDIRSGFASWRIWWLLGVGDIRQRYARSMLGQFWITLSMGIFVIAIALVYGVLFNQQTKDYLPYVAINFVVWTLIAGILTESSSVFVQAESFMRQAALPKTVFVLRLLIRSFVNFAHNAVLIPLVLLYSGVMPTWTWVLAPIGLVLIAVAGFFTILLFGVLCTRFRDLPQIIQNLVQIAFFVTPVMWPSAIVKNRMPIIVDYNPFAAFLNVVAEPMRGIVPSASSYLLALGSIALLGVAGYLLFARFRARLVYWL